VEYFKWKCPNIEVERERRKKEEVARSMRMVLERKEALRRRMEAYCSRNGRFLPRNTEVKEREWRLR